jgi:hypothetical protein
MSQARQLPAMPPIGRPESFYAQQIQLADKIGDPHLHEAFKVGQYVTLAIDPTIPWPSKLKYFDHALRRHCVPPPLPDEDVWMFYRQLSDLVRFHCGEVALKLASAKDDEFARRLAGSEAREQIADGAEPFFDRLMGLGRDKPNHFTEDDWAQLKLIRDQWV